MINFILDNNKLFSYHWCGKFQSPNSDWMHLTRNLLDFELIVVTDGTLYIASETDKYTIEKGHYLLMPPTKYQHGYQKSDCSFYWMHFSLDNEFEPTGKYSIVDDQNLVYDATKTIIPLYGKLPSYERIIIMMKQLQDCDKRYHNDTINNSIATTIITEISCQSNLYRKHSLENQTSQIFNDIQDYIQYHSTENLTVSEVADYFGYNPKYLTSFFKKQSGITIKQFMLQSKMEIAKAELTDTNHSISQIAFNIGFNDPHNFTNAFKKITGLSPSEYRESYGKRALFYT